MSDTPLFSAPLPTAPRQRRQWITPHGSALALAVSQAAQRHAGPLVVVTRDTHGAHRLESELPVFAGRDVDVLQFPDWETLPYDLFAPHPDIVSQRVAALYRLPGMKQGVLVVPVATLMQRLAPRNYIHGSSLVLATGQRFDLDGEQRRLAGAGYRHVPQVAEPGDFAVRGAIVDIFPMGSGEPYRIELLDDEIDSIRTFDPESQRSMNKVRDVRLLPAREFPLSEETAREFRNVLRERFPIDPRRCPLYQDIKEGTAPAGIEYYLPLFFANETHGGTETLFDYLSADALFLLAEGALEAAAAFSRQALDRYEQRAHDVQRPILPVAELYLSPDELRERLNRQLRVDLLAPGCDPRAFDLGTQPVPDLPINRKDEAPAAELRGFVETYPGRILITTESAGRREALIEQIGAAGMSLVTVGSWQEFVAADNPPALAITLAALEQGFALSGPALSVLTERELLGERAQQSRRRKRAARDPEAVIRDLTELALGAPIVHIDHGVGRYQGLLKLDVGGLDGEFLAIEYAKGDKLYVPVSQLHLVSRYSGTAAEFAPLHSLGGDAWERARKRAAEKVRDVAADLLAIYAQREARPGQPLHIDRLLYDQFAAAFQFEETPDQLQAIESVISDLAQPRPMDRVVCGDVGFGKTEVALRAAFVAAAAGKQVGMLAPTTLLAQQH
jgi:transcription-repair coupling factor (superfamily II helicase)